MENEDFYSSATLSGGCEQPDWNEIYEDEIPMPKTGEQKQNTEEKTAQRDIPPWQQRIEEERRKREAEAEAARYKACVEKAVKAGDIPAEVAKELDKTKPSRGVKEIVDKILEAHGGKKATSNLDGVIETTSASFGGGPAAKWIVTGADEKLGKMTPKQAAEILKTWVKDGKNPLEPGGALEQRLIHETTRFSIISKKTETVRTDLGVYNPRKPLPVAPQFKADRWRI